MCCNNRPGVATSIFIREIRSFSTLKSLPPITRPAENECSRPIFRKTSKIWTANSRVGEMIKAPNPSAALQPIRYKISRTCNNSIFSIGQPQPYRHARTGTRKPSVLPLPVFAAPKTSRFASARGIAFR